MAIAIRDQVEGALGALEKTTLTALQPESLAAALTLLGDAIRLGLATPSSLRREASGLDMARISGALAVLAEETTHWSLPTVIQDEDDPGLAWAIRRRDEIESARLAVRRILVARGGLDSDVEGMVKLEEKLRSIDLTCGGAVSRLRAERCLEDRIALEDGSTWIEAFPESGTEPESESDGGQAELQALAIAGARWFPPSDDVVAEYISRGALQKTVEAAARASTALAESLEETIDLLRREEGSSVGLVARRWLAQRRSERAILLERPDRRMAAADRDSAPETARREMDLGILQPLAVEARAELTPDQVTVRIYEEREGDVREVRLGDSAGVLEQGTWVVTASTTSGPLLFVVESQNGERFSQELSFEPMPR